MYNLYDVTKEKTNVLGFWKDENGKIFRDRIIIFKNLSGENLYKMKKILFSQGEKAVFYCDFQTAIIENANGQKQYLRHCITWQEKKLRPSLIKELVLQHNGVTVYKNENSFTFEIWKQ